jgi:hypothetical protein
MLNARKHVQDKDTQGNVYSRDKGVESQRHKFQG